MAANGDSSISMGVVSPATPWRLPVPYLFGGLAAISSLVAFSLLILSCLYCWKLHVFGSDGDDVIAREADVESGEGKGCGDRNPLPPDGFDDKVLVVMAGEVNPSFIATPMSLSLDFSSKIMSRREGVELQSCTSS